MNVHFRCPFSQDDSYIAIDGGDGRHACLQAAFAAAVRADDAVLAANAIEKMSANTASKIKRRIETRIFAMLKMYE